METFLCVIGGVVLAVGIIYGLAIVACACFLWSIGYRGGSRLS